MDKTTKSTLIIIGMLFLFFYVYKVAESHEGSCVIEHLIISERRPHDPEYGPETKISLVYLLYRDPNDSGLRAKTTLLRNRITESVREIMAEELTVGTRHQCWFRYDAFRRLFVTDFGKYQVHDVAKSSYIMLDIFFGLFLYFLFSTVVFFVFTHKHREPEDDLHKNDA